MFRMKKKEAQTETAAPSRPNAAPEAHRVGIEDRPRRAVSTRDRPQAPGTRLGLRRLRPGLIGRSGTEAAAGERGTGRAVDPAQPSRAGRDCAPQAGLALRGAFGGSTHPCRLA